MKFNKFISHILHPILVPITGTIIYFILLPRHTGRQLELTIITSVFIGTYLLPLFLLISFKKSKIIESYHLEKIEERKFPILFYTSIAYLLASLIKKGQSTMDLSLFFYGMTASLIIAYILLYTKFKTSLHMIGFGGLIGFFCFFSYEYKLNTILLIAFLFGLAGFSASSRMKLKAHHLKEVYWGFIIGFFCEVAVYIIYNI